MAKDLKKDSENEGEFGDDYVVITDEDGQEYELELLDTIPFEGKEYRAFLPVSEDDEPYEMILFRIVEEDGEELLEVIDDEDEMERVYAAFMDRLFDDDGEDEEDEE